MRIHLDTLEEILKENGQDGLFPCIVDLVVNGLTPARFPNEGRKASRQDVTQYIAAWFKYIGISSDECLNWMSKYCVDVLSSISSSSASQIRHSTKSNIKYIYNAGVSFSCGCENNHLKALCDPHCPVYEEMYNKNKQRAEATDVRRPYEIERRAEYVQEQYTPVKEKYKDQFQEAMEIVISHLNAGASRQEILIMLNERGFKTRTGREWTDSILRSELKRYNKNIDQLEG